MAGRTRGGGSGLVALALAQTLSLSPGAGVRGGCTSLPTPGRTGAGPHRMLGGSYSTGSGGGSAPNGLHPWQGGTEVLAFPSLASAVVLIREVGAGRAALPTSRSQEHCWSRLMGNRFPQCGGALWAGRACVLVWEGGGKHPRHPKHPAPPHLLPQLCSSIKSPFNAAPEGSGPRAAALSARCGLKPMGKAERGGGEQSRALRGA